MISWARCKMISILGVSTAARTSGMISTDHFDPSLVGLVVPPHTRRAGKYLLGPKLGVSPVKSIVQCLARLENSDQYFQVKLLTLYSGSGRHIRDETQVCKIFMIFSLQCKVKNNFLNWSNTNKKLRNILKDYILTSHNSFSTVCWDCMLLQKKVWWKTLQIQKI